MCSVSEAINQLVASASKATATESLPVLDSLGRILAVDICAAVDVPPADNSAMDGYAFCYADAAENSFQLPLSQRIAAGTAPQPLAPNTVHEFLPARKSPLGPIQLLCRKTALNKTESLN